MNAKNTIIGVASVMGLGLMLTILGMAASSWISTEVGDQLASAGIVPASTIDAIADDVQENADDIIRVESKAERIAQILMED